MFTSVCVPAYAAGTDVQSPDGRIKAEPLFEDIAPTNVETSYKDGRIITVTTYVLENGEVVTDTFERGINIGRSYEGSDTATRSVDFPYVTYTLTASFKWWTSSGTPGGVGSWQSVECTSAYGSYKITNDNYALSNWAVSRSDGALAYGKAWAKASGDIHLAETTAAKHRNVLTIYCDDEGGISDTH